MKLDQPDTPSLRSRSRSPDAESCWKEGDPMEIRPALAPYIPLAQMLAQTFGQDCEVVLHDLDCPEHSVVYVENPSVTGRRVGQSFDQLVRQVILSDALKEDFVANYYFTAPNGKRIRSSTLLIRDGGGHLTGALCLNLDTTRLTQQITYLQSLLPQPRAADQPEQPAAQTDAQHVAVMIENLMDRIIGDDSPLTREDRLEKIRFMDSKGIFLMKGSIERAAEKLGVNKVTIYSYLDEVRGKRG